MGTWSNSHGFSECTAHFRKAKNHPLQLRKLSLLQVNSYPDNDRRGGIKEAKLKNK
jgi:hypothetical protein